MQQKRILFIGGNFFPELTGIGKYSGEMIDWLAQEGFACTVITTFPYYPQWEVHQSYKNKSYWYKREQRSVADKTPVLINILRCPHYIPKTPSGLKRIFSDLSFFLSSQVILFLLMFKKKYDFIIVVSPPFILGLLGVIYKKIRGGKFLYHLQDLQIDAAKDLSMIRSNAVLNLFLYFEKIILKSADGISTISKGMADKVNHKTNKEIIHFPNWVDTKLFYPVYNKSDLKRAFGFNTNDKVILYSGAIGEKQGLETVILSARHFSDSTSVKFVICGTGPYKEKLEKLKKTLGLTNVIFMPLQPIQKLNLFLNLADIHLVIQKSSASDVVMPSKLATILAIGGKVIVTANEGTSLHNLIATENMGILIEPDNPEALNGAINYALKNEQIDTGKSARAYAERFLLKERILANFSSSILN
jgi:colanic acid biosynthesis glycosyl transferase WcaI